MSPVTSKQMQSAQWINATAGLVIHLWCFRLRHILLQINSFPQRAEQHVSSWHQSKWSTRLSIQWQKDDFRLYTLTFYRRRFSSRPKRCSVTVNRKQRTSVNSYIWKAGINLSCSQRRSCLCNFSPFGSNNTSPRKPQFKGPEGNSCKRAHLTKPRGWAWKPTGSVLQSTQSNKSEKWFTTYFC